MTDEIVLQVTDEELDAIENAIVFAISNGYGDIPCLECAHLKVIDYKLLKMGL